MSHTSNTSRALARRMNTYWPLVAPLHSASHTPAVAVPLTVQLSAPSGSSAPTDGFSAPAGAASCTETRTSKSEAAPALTNRTVPTSWTVLSSTRSHCGLGSFLAFALFMHVSASASKANHAGGSLYLKKVDCVVPHEVLVELPQDCARLQMEKATGVGCEMLPAQNMDGGHRRPAKPSSSEPPAPGVKTAGQ
eukprot:299275-Rhodomonas_salina.1